MPTQQSPGRAQDPFVAAVRSLRVGKKLPGATYVHVSLLPALPKVIRDAVEMAMRLSGPASRACDLLKLGTLKPTVSLLAYPRFWQDPFPGLATSWTVDLVAGTSKRIAYAQGDGTPILHRKETFLDPSDPRVPALDAVTRNLERRGLFRDTKRIGRRGVWDQMLRDAGVKVQGTEVIEVRSNPAATSRAYSAATSIRQVPGLHRALVTHGVLAPRTVNADIGGGRYDDATNLLATIGVENLVVDPGNRTPEHNRRMLDRVEDGRADSVTIANVLNVIPDAAVRRDVLELARNVARPGASIYIDCYEGAGKDAGKGLGRETPKGWQEYRRLASYLPEVREVFPAASVRTIGKGRYIVATKDAAARGNPSNNAPRRATRPQTTMTRYYVWAEGHYTNPSGKFLLDSARDAAASYLDTHPSRHARIDRVVWDASGTKRLREYKGIAVVRRSDTDFARRVARYRRGDSAAERAAMLSSVPSEDLRRVPRENGRKYRVSMNIESDEWPIPHPGPYQSRGIYGVEFYDRGPVRIVENRALMVSHLRHLGISDPEALIAIIEGRLRGITNAKVPYFSFHFDDCLKVPWEYSGVRGVVKLTKNWNS